MHVTFASGSLTLEGELSLPALPTTAAAVICHPHPQYGGNMYNNVVAALELALEQLGWATLRFNFRGVGDSQGVYANGVGESEDALAAVTFLAERAGVAQVALAGYSFGAMVAIQTAARDARIERLIAVAPPLAFRGLDALHDWRRAKLFVVGDSDSYCSVAALQDESNNLPPPSTVVVLPATDHFFAGSEAALRAAVASFVSG